MNNKRFSWVTIGYGVYIVVSASFMLQVDEWLEAKVGLFFLSHAFWTAAIFVLVVSIAYALISKPRLRRVSAVILVFALGYLVGMLQKSCAEKVHVLVYGLLGYIASRDILNVKIAVKVKDIAIALGFVALISACDEGFQLILPYRFGDFNDFATNVLSGAVGVGLFLALKKRRD